ncbi:MAG: fibronectin type III domain-containing protein [Deltaproteobacteria bacterium]|nr:fibronectin type III domain-containing protein [Deltaproteobacteria bacterium]
MKTKWYIFFSCVVVLLFAASAFATDVHFKWDASSGTVEGYRIYYGSSHEGPYSNLLGEVGGTTTDYVATLDPSKTYYLVVRAFNSYGESGNSNEIVWPTAGSDITPPGDVAGFTAIPGNGKIVLTWTNPTDTDFKGVMVRCRTDKYPTDRNDGELVCDKTGSPGGTVSFTHTQVQNGMTYYYSAFTYDTSGNYSHTAHASATPHPAPTVTISANPTAGYALLKVTFGGSGQAYYSTIASWSWDFGDGHTATGQNVTHTYANVASDTTYKVTLTVTDTDSLTGQATTYITVKPGIPLPPSKPTVQQ